MKNAIRNATLAAAVTLGLAACASIEQQVARDSVEILAEAGFRTEAAAQFGAIPAQRQLTAVYTAGGMQYAFVDGNVAYVGGDEELIKLNTLVAARERAHKFGLGAGSAGSASGTWGPWKPEGVAVEAAALAKNLAPSAAVGATSNYRGRHGEGAAGGASTVAPWAKPSYDKQPSLP